MTSFDFDARENPEGIAVDRTGNVFVSMIVLGQVLVLRPGSDVFEVFGSVPAIASADPPLGPGDERGAGLIGLAVNQAGDVFAGAQMAGASGVWRFDCATGQESRIPGTEGIGWANSLAFDEAGDLYVTDTFSGMEGDVALGALWRIGADGTVEKWVESAELGGTGQAGAPTAIGVNGLAIGDGTIYVTNTEGGKILSIEMRDDGTAGNISTVAEIGFPDGITIDGAGRLYVAAIGESSIVRLDPDGAAEVIATGDVDGLDMPASLAIASGPDDTATLYVTNLASLPQAGTGVGPGVVAFDISNR